ncbi:hypothetical protein BBO99_00008892 [Phytophthora kernoviae]|uniref:MARVEL domain-containing protein n=2 Tax=Phytophthora kernoviae TaxID=325452 RepID=A0A3R7JPA2_9STRA|nr:hypothetical protein G195_010429 [Phytophthora kernoviae 00238/432]KAG2509779.1 hypothetical protein JM16_008633 [Phytophthora kernoviae]KAG2511554.1 hypothetical protein JM18_008662 [Phytophthora kernoviae]RLN14396.1 hypothetical protein BBI17_008909 [Phytophthora kernoviae]RLN74541.1 hypothetical protein BBO99_00008892 [Phytophthora kernoviae]
MMVNKHVPLVVRVLTIIFTLIAAGTAGDGGIKSCNYGQEKFRSGKQVYFLIVVGALVLVALTLRVLAFDVRKLRLPSPRSFMIFDSVCLLFTFASAVAVSASPVGTSVCSSKDDDIKTLLQEVCDFKCSNIVTAVVTMFMASIGFVIDILFTTGAIPVFTGSPPPEDFTFGED